MSLVFDKVLTLIPEQAATQMYLGHEHNGYLYQYYINNNHEALDQHTAVELANYDTLSWSQADKSLTTDRVDTIGIKTFPGIGACGFWTLHGEDRSKVLTPIHIERKNTTSPNFEYTVNGSKVHLVIHQPKDIDYECFRVVFRDDLFAFEFVTYELDTEIDVKYTGDYIMYIVGYAGEGSTISEDSEQVQIHIDGVAYNKTPAVDKYVENASFSSDNVLTLTMSDSTHLEAGNLSNTLSEVSFTADGKLCIEFKDGSTLVSNNTSPSGGGYYAQPPSVCNMLYYSSTTIATSYSYTYNVNTIGNLLLLSIRTRGELTIAPGGWLLAGILVESQDKAVGDVGYIQYVYIFYKIAISSLEQIEYTQELSAPSSICVLEFANANEVFIDETTRQENIASSSDMFRCTRTNNDVYVWFTNSIYFTSSTTWYVSDRDIWQIPNNGSSIPRLGVFVDRRVAPNVFTIGNDMSNRYGSCIGVRIAYSDSAKDILTYEDKNLLNYTLVPSTIPQFDNTYSNGNNTLILTGGSGYDRCYRAINVEPYSTYILTFDFASPTGFSCAYGSSTQYFFVSAVKPNDAETSANKYSKLGYSEALNMEASSNTSTYTITFNSDVNSKVYFAVDFGYMLDNVQVTLLINNITLKKLK